MNPYQELANAIIVQAAKDYRSSLLALKKNPQKVDAAVCKYEVEHFFRSAWYRCLSSIEGEWIVRKLREEVGFDDT